jgi:hypothetical protein
VSEQEPSYIDVKKPTHWKSAMGKNFIGAWDCLEDRVVTITRVQIADLPGTPSIKANKRPALSFDKTDKKLLVNATIGDTIARLYGPNVLDWIGKRITLFATTDRGQGGKSVECVRVRPAVPKGPDTGVPKLPVDEEMRKRQADALGQTYEGPDEDDPDKGP